MGENTQIEPNEISFHILGCIRFDLKSNNSICSLNMETD
jgi:hypothetical protein